MRIEAMDGCTKMDCFADFLFGCLSPYQPTRRQNWISGIVHDHVKVQGWTIKSRQRSSSTSGASLACGYGGSLWDRCCESHRASLTATEVQQKNFDLTEARQSTSQFQLNVSGVSAITFHRSFANFFLSYTKLQQSEVSWIRQSPSLSRHPDCSSPYTATWQPFPSFMCRIASLSVVGIWLTYSNNDFRPGVSMAEFPRWCKLLRFGA